MKITITFRFGFVEFMGEEDADYAMRIMNMIKLFGKPIKVNKASANEKNLDVGANLFVGNLDPEVDEKLLFDTFSAFGVILQVPKIMRDTETGSSKGYAFINFASFEASDAALEAMNGQYLCNRAITCSYAYKKDAKGERHGTAAERLLAAQNPIITGDRPHQMFAELPTQPSGLPGLMSIQPVPPAPPQMAPNLPVPPPPMLGGALPPHMMPMGMPNPGGYPVPPMMGYPPAPPMMGYPPAPSGYPGLAPPPPPNFPNPYMNIPPPPPMV